MCTVTAATSLLLGRKAMTNLVSVLKNRVEKQTSLWQQMSIYSKFCFSSSQVQMWELDHKESWVSKKWGFWTVVLEKSLSWDPLDCKIKPVVLKEINLEYSLEGLILKLNSNTFATWCKMPAHWKRPWFWERWNAKGEESSKRWNVWLVSLTQWIWIWANSRRQWRAEKCCSLWIGKESDAT